MNVKRQMIRQRGYVHLELEHEDVAQFEYKPTACHRGYRLLNWTELAPAFFRMCDSLQI